MKGGIRGVPGAPAGTYLAGRRGAGKTTAAEILRREMGARVVRITDPLYEVARRYFGMQEKDRLLLQRLGDAFRAVDAAWLARHAAGRLAEMAEGDELLVIEGVRTREEAQWLNAHGWIGVLVVAPEAERLARRTGEPPEADSHRTEQEVDALPVAAVVPNAGAEALARRLLATVTGLRTPLRAGTAWLRPRRYHWHVLEGPGDAPEVAGCFRYLRHAEAAVRHLIGGVDRGGCPWWGNPRDGYSYRLGHEDWHLELHVVPAQECRLRTGGV